MPELTEFLTSFSLFSLLVAVSLAIAHFFGNRTIAQTNKLNAIAQREWEKEKWSREQTATAYKECLKHLSDSWHLPFERPDGKKLQVKDFLGRMSSLKYVPAWAAVLESYSSEESRQKIKTSREELTVCMKAALKDSLEKEEKELIPEHGLTTAIDEMLREVISCAKKDLTQNNTLETQSKYEGETMPEENQTANCDKLSINHVYDQLYHEMRRHRDYELTVATWWATLLLALLSGIVWAKSQDWGLAKDLIEHSIAKSLLTAFVLAVGFGLLQALHYTNLRYNTWRTTCNKFAEPEFVKEAAGKLRKHNCWTPLMTIVTIIIAIISGILLVLWYEQTWWALGLSVGWACFALIYWWVLLCENLMEPRTRLGAFRSCWSSKWKNRRNRTKKSGEPSDEPV